MRLPYVGSRLLGRISEGDKLDEGGKGGGVLLFNCGWLVPPIPLHVAASAPILYSAPHTMCPM